MTVLVALLLALFVLPHPWGLVAVVASIGIEVGEAWFWIRFSRRRQSVVGAEALIGATGVVLTPCRPAGQVRVGNEIWDARCEPFADVGANVQVIGREGLTLHVEPV